MIYSFCTPSSALVWPAQHHTAGNSLIVSVQTVYTFLVAKTCLIILYLFYINTALSYINFILRIPQTTSQFKAQRNLKMQERSMQTKWNKLDFYKNDHCKSSGRWCCARVSEKSYSCPSCQSQCLIYLTKFYFKLLKWLYNHQHPCICLSVCLSITITA